jgi:hypothetical protein
MTLPRLAQANNIYCPYLVYVGQKMSISTDNNFQPVSGGVPPYTLAGINYISPNGHINQVSHPINQEAVEKMIGQTKAIIG